MAATTDESIPPESPMTHLGEAVLHDVVARPQHQRLPDLGLGTERGFDPGPGGSMPAGSGRGGARIGDVHLGQAGGQGPPPGIEEALAERGALGDG